MTRLENNGGIQMPGINIETSGMLKGVLCILVILHHLQYGVDLAYLHVFKHIGAAVVSTFFFLSGYGLMSSYQKKGQAYFVDFWAKKFYKILWPFLIVNLLYLIFNSFDKGMIQPDLWKNFVTKGITPLPYSWFVFTIILFYPVFYFIFSLRQVSSVWKILLLTLSVFLYIFFMKNQMNFERSWWVSVLGFPMGFIFCSYQAKFWTFVNTDLNKILFILFFLAIGAGLALMKIEILYIFVYAIIPVIVITFISLFEIPRQKYLIFLGAISFEMYLLHGMWIFLLRGQMIQLHSDYTYVFAVFLLTLVTAYLLKLVLASQKKNPYENSPGR